MFGQILNANIRDTLYRSSNYRKEEKNRYNTALKIVQLNGKIKLGPFDIEFVTLTHSILEPNGLSIETPAGIILHTGD